MWYGKDLMAYWPSNPRGFVWDVNIFQTFEDGKKVWCIAYEHEDDTDIREYTRSFGTFVQALRFARQARLIG